jgi:hypothetical protein
MIGDIVVIEWAKWVWCNASFQRLNLCSLFYHRAHDWGYVREAGAMHDNMEWRTSPQLVTWY